MGMNFKIILFLISLVIFLIMIACLYKSSKQDDLSEQIYQEHVKRRDEDINKEDISISEENTEGDDN